MNNMERLLQCTDMTEQELKKCLKQVDIREFIDKPIYVLKAAGVTLRKGITIQLVETEEAANAMPENVCPILIDHETKDELTHEDLDKIAGGIEGDFNTGTYLQKPGGRKGESIWVERGSKEWHQIFG
jgi:hypothetical protein